MQAPHGDFCLPDLIEGDGKEPCFLASDSVSFNLGSKFHLESSRPLHMVRALLFGNLHRAIPTPLSPVSADGCY